MPIYEYRCKSCGNELEKIFRIADYVPTVECDNCGKEAVRFYTPVHFSVDNFDRRGYDPSAGRAFKNKNEFKEYLKENKLAELGPEDAANAKRKYKEMKEAVEAGVTRGTSTGQE